MFEFEAFIQYGLFEADSNELLHKTHTNCLVEISWFSKNEFRVECKSILHFKIPVVNDLYNINFVKPNTDFYYISFVYTTACTVAYR